MSEILGILATAIGLIGYGPYLWKTAKGQVRPHIFSWFLWGILTGIGFAAQVTGEGGFSAGTWVTGMSAAASFIGAGLAFYHGGKRDITKSDWIVFAGVMAAIPVWVLTDSPFWSVILITFIDAAAFAPTFRKGWQKPNEDSVFVFLCSGIKYAVALLALQHYTVVTALFPASLVLTNGAFITMLLLRRHSFKNQPACDV